MNVLHPGCARPPRWSPPVIWRSFTDGLASICILIHSCKMPKESEMTGLSDGESGGWFVMRQIRHLLTYSSHTHTLTHLTAPVSRYQKGKTNLDITEARDSEWQWHQLGHMQICTSLQTDNHASTPPLSFFTGRMPFLPPMQPTASKH